MSRLVFYQPASTSSSSKTEAERRTGRVIHSSAGNGVEGMETGTKSFIPAGWGWWSGRRAAAARCQPAGISPLTGSRQWPLVLQQTAMATGITVTSHPDPAQLESLGVTSWPTWGCRVSTFPWTKDAQESCLLLEREPHQPAVYPCG
jgi:hypothetical protein